MQISEVATHKKSRKRCAVHVHISNLIRSLQVPNDSKDKLMQPSHQTDQLKPNEGSAHGIVIKVENFNRVSSGITSVSGSAHFDTVKDSQESKNSILQQPRRYHDIPQEAPIPDVYGPQKQVSLRLVLAITFFFPFLCIDDCPCFCRVSICCPCLQEVMD